MYRLPAEAYDRALTALLELPINTLFAQAVLRGHMDGEVYANQLVHPTAFYVLHSSGMALLYGETGDPDFERQLYVYITNAEGARRKPEWLQAYPEVWNKRLAAMRRQAALTGAGGEWNPESGGESGTWLSGERNAGADGEPGAETGGKRSAGANAEPDAGPDRPAPTAEQVRVNFRFDRDRYEQGRGAQHRLAAPQAVPFGRGLFGRMPGSVVPEVFWRSETEFLEHGAGFCLFEEGVLAAAAFSAFAEDGRLEIGIETLPSCRGRGYAYAVCAALIDYCLERGLEPVWSCREGNAGSYALARKLGFVPTITLPYYRLE
ncbi:GNAT family N-acetyltransferase [Paenibacillus sp. CN-4]|uniref:GNAT family N-acetyltransferase n=1 Tax=Paenibacillus nanchangensis TaxID=3348343 RepID=UPI00397AF961